MSASCPAPANHSMHLILPWPVGDQPHRVVNTKWTHPHSKASRAFHFPLSALRLPALNWGDLEENKSLTAAAATM